MIFLTCSFFARSGGIEQFFTSWLTAGEHYIELDRDFGNLELELDRLRKNPKEAERIAEAGRQAAADFLDVEFLDLFMMRLMQRLYKDHTIVESESDK